MSYTDSKCLSYTESKHKNKHKDGIEMKSSLKHKLVFKCSLNEEEARKKVELGFKRFELHTTESICNEKSTDINGLLHVLPDIVSVHAPLYSDLSVMGADCVDPLQVGKNLKMCVALTKAMRIAQECAYHYGHMVNVITHIYRSSFEMANDSTLFDSITTIKNLMGEYPGVRLYIENMSPVNVDFRTGITYPSGGCTDEAVYAYKKLEHVLGDRVGTVFDVTHSVMCERIFSKIKVNNDFTLNKHMSMFTDSCHYVHLARCVNLGIKSNEHGMGFEKYEDYLSEIMDDIDSNLPGCDICLEMREKDYTAPYNAIHARNWLMKEYGGVY